MQSHTKHSSWHPLFSWSYFILMMRLMRAESELEAFCHFLGLTTSLSKDWRCLICTWFAQVRNEWMKAIYFLRWRLLRRCDTIINVFARIFFLELSSINFPTFAMSSSSFAFIFIDDTIQPFNFISTPRKISVDSTTRSYVVFQLHHEWWPKDKRIQWKRYAISSHW